MVVLLVAPAVHAEPANNALPTGGQITSGVGSINTAGNTMTVNQGSDLMIANWNTFNIGRDATVRFQQPSTSAVALNRVTGGVSQIFGSLQANGQVFLINPSGVIFGRTAQVDVGSVVASTLNMSDADFLARRNVFTNGGSAGSILNQGAITAGEGGVIALVAPQVRNEGSLSATKGTVALAAADTVVLDFVGDGLVTLRVDQAAFNAAVENAGDITADGGLVAMSAKSANAIFDTVVNTEGLVRADSIAERQGRIVLDGGEAGVTRVAGTLRATGNDAGEAGGRIDVTGDKVVVTADAVIDASGQAGGGKVRLGGDSRGLPSDIRNANSLSVEAGVTLKADALDNGDGGSVILWSDNTSVAGAISAVGGANGGDGGFVETSGKNLNLGEIFVDTAAPNGAVGHWSVDPTDLTISANNITTGNVNYEADNSITVNTGISIQTDGNIVFASDVVNSGGGHIYINGASITSTGGSITIGGGNTSATGYAKGSSSGDYGVLINASQLTANSGTITIRGQGYTPGLYNAVGAASAQDSAGIGVDLTGSTTMSAQTIAITAIGGTGQAVRSDSPAGAGMQGYATSGNNYWAGYTGYASNGGSASGGAGAVGLRIATGATVSFTGTTSVTLTATGGNGGGASFLHANQGGTSASGGAGAIGYQQLGVVAFNAPTATIDGTRGTGGSASGATYHDYGDVSQCSGTNGTMSGCTTWYNPVSQMSEPGQGTMSYGKRPFSNGSNSSGSDGSYGIYVGGNLSNSANGSTFNLNSTGNAHQASGTLTATHVLMQGGSNAWNYTFEQSGNNIATLAGRAAKIFYRDSQDLLIGTVNSVAGITTTSGTYIQVDSKSGGAQAALIQDSGATNISAGTNGVFTADTMLFNGNADTVTGTNIVLKTYTNTTNIVIGGTDPNPGSDLYLSTSEIATFAASINQLAIGRSDAHAGATATITSTTFKPNTSVAVNGGNITLVGAVSAAGKTLNLHTSGSVSDSSGTASVTATSLSVTGGAAVSLTNTSNSISNFAANATGKALDLINTGSLSITTVNASVAGGNDWNSESPTASVNQSGISSLRTYINTTQDLTVAQNVGSTGTYSNTNSSTPTDMNDRMGAGIVLTAGRYYYNTRSSSALTATNSRWLVYSTTPDINSNGTTPANHRNGQNAAFKMYALSFLNGSTYNYDSAALSRALPTTGNGYLYSARPTLTISPTTGQTGVYGDTHAPTGYSAAGYIDGDSANSLGGVSGAGGISGTATYSGVSATTGVGAQNLTYTGGLVMQVTTGTVNLGYNIIDNAAQNGEFTVTARPITITPDASQTKIYGDADPVMTYSAVYTGNGAKPGLVNGDTLTGLLARAAGNNVGTYAIQQGTVTTANNANYTITYNASDRSIAITPRPITLLAVNKNKITGQADPALTYTLAYTGGGKVALGHSDTAASIFTGALAREVGENVGTYAILQGTMQVNSNYTLTYQAGRFEIRSDLNTSNLTSNQTGVTGTSTANTSLANLVGPGTGSNTLLSANNNQVVFNNIGSLAPQPSIGGVIGPAPISGPGPGAGPGTGPGVGGPGAAGPVPGGPGTGPGAAGPATDAGAGAPTGNAQPQVQPQAQQPQGGAPRSALTGIDGTVSGLTLSTGVNSAPVSVSRANNTLTVSFGAQGGAGGNAAGGNIAPAPGVEAGPQSTLSLFTAGAGGTAQGRGAFAVVQTNTSISASAAGNVAAPPAAQQTLITEPATGSLTLPSGGTVPMTVGVSAEGVLVIEVPGDAAQQVDPETTMLLGLALAKQNLGNAADGVQSVLIRPAAQ